MTKKSTSDGDIERPERGPWRTADEINFIKTLGHHGSSASHLGRRALLLGYLEALPKRVIWHDASAVTVRAYAEAALAQA
jgi:hypothetical protein